MRLLATLVLALFAVEAHAQPFVPDSTPSARSDSAQADTTRALPEPSLGAPPSGTPPPLRTRTKRGGPYNVVADRLEGGRTAAEGDVVTLIGNVTLTRAGTTVTSQMGRYVKRDGTIYLSGGVHAVDGKTRIDAIEAAYNEQSDFLTLTGSVVVRDKDLILTGDYGSYDQQQGRAEIWSHVRGRDQSRTLQADRVTYLRDLQIAQARGRVVARDSVQALTLTAEAVDYDKNAQVARATLNPKLVQLPKDGKGAVTLTGDTITVDSAERIAHAEGRVHVVQDSLEANAGRAVFYDRESRGLLLDAPRASTGEVTVKGDTLEVFTRGKALDRMKVHGSGAIDYRGGGLAGQVSTLTADRMEMWFSGDAIDSMTALQNAANEFTGAPAAGRRPESNRTEGDMMRLRFVDKALKQAIVTGNAKGVYSGESALADSAAVAHDRVEYEAGRITFEVTKNRIRLEDNAHLSYQDLSLHSPEVVFDSKKQVFEARGNPVLEDKGDTLTGRAMAYDLAARKGAVFGARTRYETGWYTGEKIRRLGDSVLDVKGATYSTCNLLHPHYSFQSDRMKIYLKDKIIARPVVFAVRGIPLLALPFYVFPIRDDRHSGVLVPQLQFGFGSSNGFIRNAGYYWAPNDYTDFTVAGDYYPSEPSLRLRGEARYKVLYKFEGQIAGSYTPAMNAGGQNGGDLRATHQQQIGENTTLSAQGNFTSSADYTRDPLTGQPLANRIDRFLTSSLTLAHREPWASFNLFVQRRQDLDAVPTFIPVSKIEDFLPTLSIALPTRTIGHKGVNGRGSFLAPLSTTYLSFNSRFVNIRNESLFLRLDSTQVDSTVARWAYTHAMTLTDSRRLFGFINVGPSFRYTQVVFDEDRTGSGPAAGATWGVAGSASMTVYGTSHGGVGPIRSFRHVFNPSVTYGYQPDFSSLRLTVPTSDSTSTTIDRFGTVGGIGISGAQQSFVSFNVANRFELKVKQGTGEKTISNLLSVNLNTAYDFLYQKSFRTTPWRPVLASIRVQPPNYVSGDLTLNYDPMFAKALRSATASLGLRFSGGGASIPVTRIPLAGNEAQTAPPADPLIPWEVSLSFSHGGSRGLGDNWNHTEAANAVLGINPTPNWQLRYYNQVDLTERRIVAQEYALTRMLHCWNFQFVRRFSGGTADYYFRIGINARPEIFLDRGTTGIGGLSGLSGLPGASSFVP